MLIRVLSCQLTFTLAESMKLLSLTLGRCCLVVVIAMHLSCWTCISSGQDNKPAAGQSAYAGPMQIVAILWDSSPQSAASTLRTTLQNAVEREQLDQAAAAVESLADKSNRVLASADEADPRWISSLAVQMLLGQKSPEMLQVVEKLIRQTSSVEQAEVLVAIWFHADAPSAMEFLQENLSEVDPSMASVLIEVAFETDRLRAAGQVLELWPALSDATRFGAIEPLTRSQDTMSLLVAAARDGKVDKDLVNANQLRKWILEADGDASPSRRQLVSDMEAVWGKIRASDDAQRQAIVRQVLDLLASGKPGSVARGELVFQRVCSQCHVLHGKGLEVGPPITANGRGSLQQLASNIFDPSLVIGEAFQAKTVLTVDGEVVSGLVVGETDRYLKLKVQGGKVTEFDKQLDIEQVKQSGKSLMPEGLEAQMNEQEMLDLFAYLCLLKPLGSQDNELIPGTPDGLVQP